MIVSMVVFRGNIWKKLVTVCCYYVLAIIPEFLFAALTNAYGVTGASEGFRTETEKTLALLLMSTMTFLFIKCINQVTRKRDYLTIENKSENDVMVRYYLGSDDDLTGVTMQLPAGGTVSAYFSVEEASASETIRGSVLILSLIHI